MGKTTCIIGAGITGSTIANLLAKAGYKVTVYEKEHYIGGACNDRFSMETDEYHQTHGSHIFHTNNKKVWDYLSEFTYWAPYQHKVKALIDGDLVPIPFNQKSLEFLDYWFAKGIKSDLFTCSYGHEFRLQELLDSEDTGLRELGQFIKKNVFDNYSLKQWGQIPKDEVINRVKAFRNSKDCRYFLDKYQGIPMAGFHTMIENMLSHENIDVKMNSTRNLALLKNYSLVIYTGAIDELFDYQLGELPYRTCDFVEVSFEPMQRSQECAVINYPNDYSFTRSHDYSHYIPGTTSGVYTEHPRQFDKDKDESSARYYPINNQENDALYTSYRKLAQEQCPNVAFAGRLGTYKYLNMDTAIEQAFDIVDNILNR